MELLYTIGLMVLLFAAIMMAAWAFCNLRRERVSTVPVELIDWRIA